MDGCIEFVSGIESIGLFRGTEREVRTERTGTDWTRDRGRVETISAIKSPIRCASPQWVLSRSVPSLLLFISSPCSSSPDTWSGWLRVRLLCDRYKWYCRLSIHDSPLHWRSVYISCLHRRKLVFTHILNSSESTERHTWRSSQERLHIPLLLNKLFLNCTTRHCTRLRCTSLHCTAALRI